MNPVRPLASALAAVAVVLLAAPAARAQDYPTKPIRFVVSSPPGGVVDVRARRFGQPMSESLKQPIVVENRPGASTAIGAELVAGSPPDGYTALFGGNTELVTNPALGGKVRYDAKKDFIPTAQFTVGYPVMVVNADLGPKTLPALIAWAKANPGKLLCATAGHATGSHFICELLARSAGIQLQPVAYKGSGPMLMDTASGQVHLTVGYLAEVDKQYIQPGRVIPIGVLSPKRIERFPDLPTMAEQGHQGFEMRSWTGLFLPAGTPDAIVERLNAEVRRVVQTPDIAAWLKQTGSEVVTPSAAEFKAFVHGDYDRWHAMSMELGIRAAQ